MFNDEWLKPGSFMYEFDPRLKILAVFLCSILIAVSQTWSCLACGAVFALTLAYYSDLSLIHGIKRLVPVNGMVIFLWFCLPFTVSGVPVFQYSFLTATQEGIHLALLISAKANILMLMFIAFVVSTPVIVTGHALARFGIPSKLVHLFFFTYRYIHVIYDEYQTLKTAMLVRGFVPRTSIHTYKAYAYLVGMLIVKSSNRAERVYRAMVCRGFHGKLYSLKSFSIGKRDRIVFCVLCVWILVMGWMEWIDRLV